MLELGDIAEKAHKNIALIISKMNIDLLITVGNLSKSISDTAKTNLGNEKCVWVQNEEEVDIFIKPFLKENSLILLKGSRSVGLDKVVARLFK